MAFNLLLIEVYIYRS